MTTFYTRSGDKGFSCGIPKNDQVFQLIGSLDELQSFLGLSKVLSSQEFYLLFEYLQHCMFKIQAQLYNYKESNKTYLTQKDLTNLEENIEYYGNKIDIDCFTLTGACQFASTVDCTRTIARRVEREYITYSQTFKRPLEDNLIMKFLNRLSSLLFVIAKYYDTDKVKVNYFADYSIV